MPPAPLTLTTPPTLWAAWIRFLTKVRATISCSWKSTMSDKNLNKPCEGQDEPPLFLANRGRLLDIDSNYSLSLSPDSASCNFNLSVRRDCTSPDINTQSADGPILHPNNTIITLPQGKRFTNLENSLIASPDSSRINFWNDSLSFLSCQDSDRNKTFYKTASEGSNSEVASPDSVGMSSCRTSHRGSMDLSFSSAEMVVRSNSFVLDQQASVLSSLEESSAPPVSSHDESKSLLIPFSETGGAGDQAGDHPCFGMTFVFEDKMELPSEEHEATSNSSFLALPGEGENFSTTFLCKNSDIKNDTPFISSRSELLYESASLSEDSHRKSVDLSFSSAEMVVRGNSFILEEQAVPSLMSSFDESLAPPTSSHIESKSLLASAASVKDGAGDQAGDQLSLGTTFVLGDKVELPSEEVGGMCNSFLALPGEKHGLHISPLSTTFLYENSTSDCANDAQFIFSEAELHNESKPLSTPDQVMTFDTPLFSVKDKDICTSTPVQNLGTHLPNLASFAVSPCTENTGSPAPQPMLKKKNSVSPKQFERGTPVSGNKVTKMGVDKFPKSNMSSVRCKMRRAEGSSLLLDKPLQMNAKQEGNKVGSRPSPTRINNGATTPVSAVLNPQRKLYIRANKDLKDGQRNSFVSEESQAKSRTVHASLSIDTSKQAPAVHCSPASCDTEQEPTGHANTDPKVNIANTTFCYPDKSPPKNDKVVTKPASKTDKTNTIKKVKSGSTLGHEKSTPSTPSTRPRSSSESSTALSRLFRMAKPQRLSASFSLPISKNKNPKSQTKLGNQENSSPSKPGSAKESTETNCRKVKKIVLVSHSSTLSSASCTETKTRVRGQPSPNLTGRASTSKSSAASQKTTAPMAATPLNMQRSGASDRERSRTNLLLKSKIKGNTKTPGDTAPAVNNKPGSSQRLQTPSRSSVMDPPPTFGPRLQPRKVCGPSRIQPGSNESGVHRETSDSTKTTQVSGAASRRSTPCKFPILKARLNTTPAKTTPAKASAPVLTALCKTTGPTKGLPNCHISSQKRTTTNTTKLIRFTTSVDKNKPKVGSRPQQQQQQGERGLSRPHQDVGPLGVSEARRNAEKIQHLRTQLAQSNKRFEAFTVVLQQTLAQRDEAVRQSRGLSQELQELRKELVSTVNKSECLAQEKEALQGALQQALDQVKVQHHRDLQELEQRLREAHREERRDSEQGSREERERSAQTLQLQLEELRAAHNASSLDLEQSHRDQLQSLRQQHQLSLDELMTSHTQELQSLLTTLKDTETVLNEKIQELTQENKALMEKLTEEENRREISQKDSHTVYLEQDLESLKVVLDIKNQQLHQQEKKLMEVDKLTEKNLKLEKSLRKSQQENEELKAQMDRHAALSRQLSTEQALLQESLQKESEVNKRLSMDNEELMWKLHNGDLISPRKTSPHARSPSPQFSLHSPRSPSLLQPTCVAQTSQHPRCLN